MWILPVSFFGACTCSYLTRISLAAVRHGTFQTALAQARGLPRVLAQLTLAFAGFTFVTFIFTGVVVLFVDTAGTGSEAIAYALYVVGVTSSVGAGVGIYRKLNHRSIDRDSAVWKGCA
jgi:hypothetical protein